ncbi:Wzz/FepE/Etk N-terminal domain-containing protein [Robertmurraya massiliosenegalensis]|uniref:Wzz/FepE/Etk N-terminal domain-containing protein n=1 Tax=Robertmurraya TaxID=2837507 RepID=UPI0039A54842
MQEEISLRELIEVVLKGKKLIAIITILSVLAAAIVSYFVLDPTYETKATILVNNTQQEGNSNIDTYLNEVVSPQVYSERVQSQKFLKRVIDNHNLKDWTVSELINSLTVGTATESNMVTLTLGGKDSELIYKTLDAIITEANVYIGEAVTERLTDLAHQYEKQLSIEKENLDQALVKYNEARAAEGLPTIVLLDALTSGQKQYILNVDDKYLEEIQSLDKNKQVEFQKLNNQVNTLTELYNKYSKNYEEARSVSSLYNVEDKLTLIAAPEVPMNPVGPKKMLNMAISMVIGLIASVGIVFFVHYWKESGKDS